MSGNNCSRGKRRARRRIVNKRPRLEEIALGLFLFGLV